MNMKIIRIVFVLLVSIMCTVPVFASPKGEMGDLFRTVKISFTEPLEESIYYLAVPAGAKPPPLQKIVDYGDGKLKTGLDDGTVVRGYLHPQSSYSYQLQGAEGLDKLDGEMGFADGKRYDIYFSTGDMVRDVMALPFAENRDGIFIISNSQQLANIHKLAVLYKETNGLQGCLNFLTCSDMRYALGADINIPPNWVPIGAIKTVTNLAFKGEFDGQGYKITGLSQGLFNKLEDAKVNGIVLENANMQIMSTGEIAAGLLAGQAINSVIENIKVANSVISVTGAKNGDVGGLVGKGTGLMLADIHIQARIDVHGESLQTTGGLAGHLCKSIADRVLVSAEINAASVNTGGVAGQAVDSKFYHSGKNTGRVIGTNIVGGFAGSIEGTSLVIACQSNADVEGLVAGGLAGLLKGGNLSVNANHSLEIFQCRATGNITSPDGIAAGFVGKAEYAAIKDSSAYGAAYGHTSTGGFVGQLSNYSRVIYAYAMGNVFSKGGYTGGFVGEIKNTACIEFAYSAGAVIARDDALDSVVGGFVGVISASGPPNTITHSLSFAPWVVGPKYVHRFAGRADHEGVNGCYAFLGSMVVRNGAISHVLPSAFSHDGADMSSAQLEEIVSQLGWTRPVPVIK